MTLPSTHYLKFRSRPSTQPLGHVQYCSFETCGEFTGNIHMNSPQENSPWGIPLGESDSLPQANWWIHEECPGNQIHGEFPMVNSPWWILHWDSLGNSWWWIKMLLSMYARRRIVNLKQTQRVTEACAVIKMSWWPVVILWLSFFFSFVVRKMIN